MNASYNITDINVRYLPEDTFFGRCLSIQNCGKGDMFVLKIEHIIAKRNYNKYEKIKVKLNDPESIVYFFSNNIFKESHFFYFKVNEMGIHSITRI